MKIAKEINGVEIPENYENLTAMQQLSTIWKIIVVALTVIKWFVGDEADAKIDKVIDWGNRNLPA